MNKGTMGVNSLPKTVTRQLRGCDLNPGPSAPESSTLTTRLSSHPVDIKTINLKTSMFGCTRVVYNSAKLLAGWRKDGG